MMRSKRMCRRPVEILFDIVLRCLSCSARVNQCHVCCACQESDQPDLDWKPAELQPDLNNADSDEEFDKLLHRELESDYWLKQFSTCTSKIQTAAVVDKVFEWCERQIDNKKTLMSFAHAKADGPLDNVGAAGMVRALETFVFKLLPDCQMEVEQ
jgi:hypothetical protein